MPSPQATQDQIDARTFERPAHLKDRWGFEEKWLQRPALNATLAPTTLNPTAAEIAAMNAANKNWEISGDQAIDADVDFYAGGGVTIGTAGAATDGIAVAPHTDTLQSALIPTGGVNLGSEDEPFWEGIFRMPAITNILVWMGFALTPGGTDDTPAATLTRDANAAFFMFSTEGAESTTKFTAAESLAGSDSEVAVAADVVANKDYRLTIKFASDRRAHYYVDGIHVLTGSVMTNDIDFIPVFGAISLATAEKFLTNRWLRIARTLNVN